VKEDPSEAGYRQKMEKMELKLLRRENNETSNFQFEA
jgi:hypothetical protein